MASISLVMESFDLDGTSVAQGFFVRRCLEMAEDQLDDRLWRLFVEAWEDHRGLMAAARLEQLLETTAEPCEVSAQEVRQLAAGQEVSFEALKDFVMQRREAACLARAQELGAGLEVETVPISSWFSAFWSRFRFDILEFCWAFQLAEASCDAQGFLEPRHGHEFECIDLGASHGTALGL